jgi:Mg2+/citrate symporter
MPHKYLIKWGLSPKAAKLLCAFGYYSTPITLGTSTGAMALQVTTFQYPLLAYVLISAVIQLVIALMRSWFSERRELHETMKQQTTSIADGYKELFQQIETQRAEDKRQRHAMANALSALSVERALLRHGVSPDKVPETDLQVIYFDALASGEHEIHTTSPQATKS